MVRTSRVTAALAVAAVAMLGDTALPQSPADTIDLACAQPVLHYKLYLSVDLSAKTAAAWFKPATLMDVHKAPATITDSTVAWTLQTAPGASSFTLDRQSGALTVLHPDRETEKWRCAKTGEPL